MIPCVPPKKNLGGFEKAKTDPLGKFKSEKILLRKQKLSINRNKPKVLFLCFNKTKNILEVPKKVQNDSKVRLNKISEEQPIQIAQKNQTSIDNFHFINASVHERSFDET